MGIRNDKVELLRRMEAKCLDGQFLSIIHEGLNCSPFEARAVLGAVREVYFPYLDEAATMAPPGKFSLMAVCADEPAGKPIAACQKRAVCLTLHRGSEDDCILREQGPDVFRQTRIPDLLQEALSQGALLTREDLAYHVFWVSPRTISRDLSRLRKQDPLTPLPLRGTVLDLGPVLSHRVEIIRLALAGHTMSEICLRSRHSPAAVANYLAVFTRCAQLAEQGMAESQIAFLLRRGPGLIRKYRQLIDEAAQDPGSQARLAEFLRLGLQAGAAMEKGGTAR